MCIILEKPLSPHGVWADHVVLQALARMLKRDIRVVTSEKSKTDAGRLIEEIESGYILFL